MKQYDILCGWVTQNLYRSNKFDRETNEVAAEKASVELGDSITSDMIAEMLHDIRMDKNFNITRYPYDNDKPSW